MTPQKIKKPRFLPLGAKIGHAICLIKTVRKMLDMAAGQVKMSFIGGVAANGAANPLNNY
ncbi:MAG: hypothetical protein HZA50_08320 [Planctomycetes bacterium]|nr:hypothetical protein [Planctomycetota bacterium]